MSSLSHSAGAAGAPAQRDIAASAAAALSVGTDSARPFLDDIRLAPARARRTDPSTSKEAAARVAEFAAAHRARILDALRSLGEAGAEQLEPLCGLPAYAIRKRLAEAKDAGQARPTGAIRRTSTGRSERVWRCLA